MVSWNSAHQLDTLALLRLKMGTFYKHSVKAGRMPLHKVMPSCTCMHRQHGLDAASGHPPSS